MHWKYNNYVLKLSLMDPSVCMTATHVTLNFDTFQHMLQFQLMLHALCLIYRNTTKSVYADKIIPGQVGWLVDNLVGKVGW